MDEIGMIFKGSLPACVVDETKVKQGDSRAGMQDCLAEHEQVKVLAFRLQKYLCRMRAPVWWKKLPWSVYPNKDAFLSFMLRHQRFSQLRPMVKELLLRTEDAS